MTYVILGVIIALVAIVGYALGVHRADKQLQAKILECRELERALNAATSKPRVVKPKLARVSASKLFGRGPNNAS